MKFGYTILYVSDVAQSVAFYEAAFSLKTRMIHEGGYAEMETGNTTLAFVLEHVADANGVKFQPVRKNTTPPGIEIAFTTVDVETAYRKAIAAGAESVSEPRQKPWGQTVAYVRDCNGFLVELCTPMG